MRRVDGVVAARNVQRLHVRAGTPDRVLDQVRRGDRVGAGVDDEQRGRAGPRQAPSRFVRGIALERAAAIVGQFDVSIGFQLGLSQTLCAGLQIKNGWPAFPTGAAGVVSCLAIGAVNGLLVTKLRLNSFIATLGVGTVVLGLTQLYGNDETISGRLPHSFMSLGQNQALDIPLPFVYVAVVAILMWLAMEYTSWGRECHATGGNPRAALLAGVRTERVTLQCFVLAGLLSGISGVLSVTILGGAAPTVGLGALLPAYAAAFLGATAFRPGRFNSAGTMLAIYLLATGVTGLQSLGAQFYVEQLFYGGSLLIALTAAALVERRRGRARV
jgi:ribose transport system permease protein